MKIRQEKNQEKMLGAGKKFNYRVENIPLHMFVYITIKCTYCQGQIEYRSRIEN